MGKIGERLLLGHLEPRTVGSAVKVGKIAAMPPEVTATAIRKSPKDNCWYYEVEEVKLQVWPNRFLEIPYETNLHLIWMGLEVKTTDFDWNGKQVAFALEPYSLNWYGNAPLRPAAKSKADAARMIRKAREKAGGDWLKALDAIAHDPFETNRKWLTARLKNPMRLHWDDVKPLGGQFAYGRSVNYTYGAKGQETKPHWVFSICEDFGQAVEDVKREIQSDYKLAARMVMEPADIFDATLTASVKQALAGRAGGTRPNRVAYAALLIHTKHMEAAAKRAGAAPR